MIIDRLRAWGPNRESIVFFGNREPDGNMIGLTLPLGEWEAMGQPDEVFVVVSEKPIGVHRHPSGERMVRER